MRLEKEKDQAVNEAAWLEEENRELQKEKDAYVTSCQSRFKLLEGEIHRVRDKSRDASKTEVEKAYLKGREAWININCCFV